MPKLPLLLATALLVSAALPAPASAQQSPPPLVEWNPTAAVDDDGPLTPPRHVALGMSTDDVTMAMQGKPDEKLSADLWVYWGFTAAAARETPKLNTLLVFFSEGRVSKYRLVEKQPVVALLAETRARAKAANTVAKK